MSSESENAAWDQIKIIFDDIRVAPCRPAILLSIPRLIKRIGKISSEKEGEITDVVREIFVQNNIDVETPTGAREAIMVKALSEIDIQLRAVESPYFPVSAYLCLFEVFRDLGDLPGRSQQELGELILDAVYA